MARPATAVLPSRDERLAPAPAGAGRWDAVLALGVGLVAVAVFWPLTRGYFHQDDFLNLQAIVNDSLGHYVFQPLGGHVLVVRNLLFLLFYRAFGTRVGWWFGAVLLTHLANVALLFLVLARLTESRRLAAFGALLWGTAPMQEGTLGWYAVYGQVVAATLLLVVLAGVADRWQRGARIGWSQTAGWCLLLIAAAASFGVGVGVAGAFPLLIALLFPAPAAGRGLRLGVFLLPALVLAGYREAHFLYAAEFGARSDVDYVLLLGLASYWQNAAAMVPHLVAAGVTGLVVGFAHGVPVYPAPLGYGLGAAFAVAFAVGLATADGRMRRLLLAAAVVVLGAYGIIATGRATFYAAGVGVPTGAGMARYHYVATIPLTVVVCLLLGRLGAALGVSARTATACLVAWLLATAGLYAVSPWRIELYRSDRERTQAAVAAIDRAIREAPADGVVVIPNEKFGPAVFHDIFVGTAAVYTIFFPARLDPRVRFVEADPAVRARARPGSRLATLLVPPAPPR